MKIYRLIAAIGAALSVGIAEAEIKLPDIIGTHMVLQQNASARLWGWATPGAKITVKPSWPGAKSVTGTAGSDGRWDVHVATPSASFTPYTINIKDTINIKGDGSNITLDDVLTGEVWFASGQSNMEMPLRGFWTQPVEGSAQAIAYSGQYPGIRMAKAPKTVSYEPQARVVSPWKVSNPENAIDFSALAFFYAEALTKILNVPVGIIDCTYGGSKVEAWQSAEQLAKYPEWSVEKEKADPTINDWERINVMYNAMLYPLSGYTIKGFIWNQGESNVGRHDTYPQHQADMVAEWRKLWNDENLPFYFVELPGWEYGNPEGIDAAVFRECQHKAAKITPNSGIVCTSDLVYPYEVVDIHARKKKEIGERMAFMAAEKTYGIPGMPCRYPTFKSMSINSKGEAVLTFENANEGFSPNRDLPGFEAAGPDGVFHPAEAQEEYNTRNIIVSCAAAKPIKAVRYCFKNFAIGGVFNLLGLPLIPFRTDSAGTFKEADKGFVTVKDGEFMLNGKPYRYVGTNFWYGPILASQGRGGDRARLAKELDALQGAGINNLRILVGGDGAEGEPSHIEPVLQTAPGEYNDTILDGLDYLIAEMERRGMKGVFYLNNAWEWSGGYGTYLEWAGAGKQPNPARDGYDKYMKAMGAFVHNAKARELAANHVRAIVGRTNRYTGKPYTESEAVMAWQIANEPRAFAADKATKEGFAGWIAEQAALIKSLDGNHLVSTGSEGRHGCEGDMELWTRIHTDPNIDYGILHLWPYNWGWVKPKSLSADVAGACAKADEYISAHAAAMQAAGKPLVMEEFGFPRDHMSTVPGSPTTARDAFYSHVFKKLLDSKSGTGLNGVNFWGWGGTARPSAKKWSPGMPYTGDPAQEDQGLNSVFDNDFTTLEAIKNTNSKL